MTATLFCAVCHKDTEHTVALNAARELEFVCPCGHPVKFPALPPDQLKDRIAAHKKAHQGQVLIDAKAVAAQQEADAKYLESLKTSGLTK